MSKAITATIAGTIVDAINVRHTVYGNPIKAVRIRVEGDAVSGVLTYETLPNAQLGYSVGNYVGKRVEVSLRDFRGVARISKVVAL